MTNKTLALCLCLSSVLVTFSARAAEWKLYFQNATGVSFFIDTSSVVRLDDGDIRAWQKQEPKDGDGFLYLLEVDCKQRRHIIRSIAPIKGTVQNMQMVPSLMEAYGDWDFFGPNDLDEATYNRWCHGQGKK